MKRRRPSKMEADVDRKEIELDQALLDKENLSMELDTNVKAVQDQLDVVKAEKEEIGKPALHRVCQTILHVASCPAASRAELQAQLDSMGSSQSSTSHEVAALKRKVDEVEREKRELFGVVSRLQVDVAQEESLKAARKDAQELESTLRDIRASERSTTVRNASRVSMKCLFIRLSVSSKSRH